MSKQMNNINIDIICITALSIALIIGVFELAVNDHPYQDYLEVKRQCYEICDNAKDFDYCLHKKEFLNEYK